jgi:hypothetical protein
MTIPSLQNNATVDQYSIKVKNPSNCEKYDFNVDNVYILHDKE